MYFSPPFLLSFNKSHAKSLPFLLEKDNSKEKIHCKCKPNLPVPLDFLSTVLSTFCTMTQQNMEVSSQEKEILIRIMTFIFIH